MARWKNSRGVSPLLVLVALVLTGAFFYWLNLQAQAVEENVEPTTEEEESGEMADLVPAQLVEDPESLIGETGVIRNVGVAESLGRGVFTVDLDGTNMYPVLLGPDIIARGTTPGGGDQVTVYGRVYSLNDSIRSVWTEGERTAVDPANADAIPSTTSFVLADSITFN
ncbi:MAG: hypothetical protein ACODAA_02855 [Gemmatimonadota bacterium]